LILHCDSLFIEAELDNGFSSQKTSEIVKEIITKTIAKSIEKNPRMEA